MQFYKNHLLHQIMAVATVLVLLLSSAGPAAAARGIAGPQAVRSSKGADPCFPQGVRSTKDSSRNVIRSVGTEPGKAIANPAALPSNATPEEAARGYLSVCGSYFGLKDPSSEMAVKTQNVEGNGASSFVHFQQTVQGIPVMGGELIVQVDQARNIVYTGGKVMTGASIFTQAGVDAATARQNALGSVAKKYQLKGEDLSAGEPELWIYDPELIGPTRDPGMLVWRLEVKTVNAANIRELVLVDAQRGSIALSFNQIDAAGETGKRVAAVHPQVKAQGDLSSEPVLGTPMISVYTMNHSLNDAALPGTLICTQSNPSACNSDPDAQKAYLYALHTYDYYAANFGRDSINGLGMPIISSVHYGTGYKNAFWNGTQMVYGDGYPMAEDVVGHELTHGVTQNESHLFYYYQSGAINESLSDVFGEFVEKTNQGDTDWLIGEDLPGGAIRDMADPTVYGDPDKMSSGNYFPGDFDNGGVHWNSGINNKAAYLMTDGGSFNGFTVTGLGMAKVQKIYYEVQTNLLTSGADYFDLYTALYQGCLNLVLESVGGITAADCLQVQNATLAVEMNSQPVTGFNPDAAQCTGGQIPSNVFFDNLEGGAGNWNHGALIGTDRWTYGSPYGPFAHSGAGFLYADDFPAQVDDTYIAMKSSVTLPANAYLYFNQAYGFDFPNYDGGVVEYSTNNGNTWTDAGSLFDTNGYNGTIFTGLSNPLAGRQAFVGYSHGYYSSRLNLTSLVGQSVRFRWRMGLDSSIYNWGWWLDDVSIYTCVPAVTITATIGGNLAGTYNLPQSGSTRVNYTGVNNGPVQVQSSSLPIIAAERDSWWSGTEWTSFSQLMGLPAGQVSDTYMFPAYNNVSLDEQMRIGNVDPTQTSVVTVTIGGHLQATYTLPPHQAVRDNYVGVNDGPVIVQGTPGVKIIAAERDSWWDGTEWSSFIQTMGLPAGQVSDTYVFPAYNNVSLDEQIRIGNVDATQTSVVTVTIGGHLQATYTLLPNQAVRDNYAGVNDGPVIVQGTPGVKIIAAERDAWWDGTQWTSFAQTMGLPAGQISDTYVFPAYNNVSLDEQMRIGNVDPTKTSVVTVTIGGHLQATYTLLPNQAVRDNYFGVNDGPVIVKGTAGVKIIAAERDSWWTGTRWTSFVQTLGLPSGLLSTTYVFPAYNNISLDEQLRFGVP